ncbi:glycosyltransferase family 2 protein [Candidatus Woesearchaeota archaeon]|nr:glycosyltransferase family 2 protein [Candidatus Woesearchaeota archaeon]
MNLSIVIPSFNRKDDLERCINSILSQNYEDYEIIIVDNGSKDGTREFLKNLKQKLNSRLKLILNSSNIGASEARNQALRIITSKYVLFLDSDAELKSENTLQLMLNLMESNERKKIGQLGGEIINGKIRLGNSERNGDGLFSWFDSLKMKETDYVPTSNCIMPLSLLKELGGFDPYYIYGYEDNDLGWRVRKKGLKCIMDDKIAAYHHVSNTGRTSNFFLFHKNRIRFLIKKEKFYFLIFLPLIDIYYAFKLLPARIKEFSQKPLEKVAWLDKSQKKKDCGKIKKILILVIYSYRNLLKAYWWNLMHLAETLRIRRENPDFIKNEI